MSGRDKLVADAMARLNSSLVNVARVPGADLARDVNAQQLIEWWLRLAYDAGRRSAHATDEAERVAAPGATTAAPVPGIPA